MKNITLIGFAILMFYVLSQIFKFWGVDEDVYLSYLLFYLIVVTFILVLPHTHIKFE